VDGGWCWKKSGDIHLNFSRGSRGIDHHMFRILRGWFDIGCNNQYVRSHGTPPKPVKQEQTKASRHVYSWCVFMVYTTCYMKVVHLQIEFSPFLPLIVPFDCCLHRICHFIHDWSRLSVWLKDASACMTSSLLAVWKSWKFHMQLTKQLALER